MANTNENQYEGKGLTFHFLKSDPLRANHQAVFISLGKRRFFIGGGGEGIISKQLDRLNSPRWRLIIRNPMYPAINPALNNNVINKSKRRLSHQAQWCYFLLQWPLINLSLHITFSYILLFFLPVSTEALSWTPRKAGRTRVSFPGTTVRVI